MNRKGVGRKQESEDGNFGSKTESRNVNDLPDRTLRTPERKQGGEMKVARITFFTILAALVAVGVSTTSYAFHSGGVAECNGCHSMHAPNQGGSNLLIGIDPSSTCLTCHEHAGDTGPSSYHISTAAVDMPAGTPPKQRTPGGDFGWLKKGYTFVVRGTTNNELAETHGHNVVAAANAYIADPVNTNAPGGTFVSSQLGCQSCHDPHGRGRRAGTDSAPTFSVPSAGIAGLPIKGSGSYGTSAVPDASNAVGIYRILAYPGYLGAAGVTWGGWPIASAPSGYNQTEALNQVRVAYGGTGNNTWANWCSSCHSDMHTSSGRLVHPVDQALSGGGIFNTYNAYVKSGDLSGTAATSFNSLVPFAEATSDFAVLKSHAVNNGSQLGGPAGVDRVTCLSCHRAHATAFPEMLRWNMENEFIVSNGAYQIESRGRTNAEAVASYYDRPVTQFASYQRVLCNKCHAKD
jgi:predicted CXXCH cytochrome family protein